MFFIELQVLGLGLGVDFVFSLSQEGQEEQEPYLNFLKGTVPGDKEQGVGIRVKG